jgi:hypothetical protein
MTPQRSTRRRILKDRTHAAIHEAGHFVVAEWTGASDHGAWIGPRAFNDLKWESAGTGQYSFRPFHFDRLSKRRQIMIAMAGACAE